MQAPSLTESVAFTPLLEGSQPFRSYYAEERSALGDFALVQDQSLPLGVRARTTWVDGRAFLRVPGPVCPLEDACLIAHELGHLALAKQGFPAVGGMGDHPAAAALNSALQDPLVDSVLVVRGFDVNADREREVADSESQLRKVPPPTHPADRAHWTANFLGTLLTKHVLGSIPVEDTYCQWFAARYPRMAARAEAIAQEVIAIGFDSPSGMYQALAKARKMLNAGPFIVPPSYPT
jgi:hypothetical protein